MRTPLSYLLPTCDKCDAAGTIVEMGACCRVRDRLVAWAVRDLPPPARNRLSGYSRGARRRPVVSP